MKFIVLVDLLPAPVNPGAFGPASYDGKGRALLQAAGSRAKMKFRKVLAFLHLDRHFGVIPKGINFYKLPGSPENARKASSRKALRPENELWPANRFASHSLIPRGMNFPMMTV